MSNPRRIVFGITAIGAAAALPAPLRAQEPHPDTSTSAVADSVLAGATVVLRVDGMVCPFCAYGLDRRLRKLAAVDSVVVRISDGVVQLREKPGQRVTNDMLQREVTKAGFTLRGVRRVDDR